MSATNGSLRSRSRLIGLALVVVLALGAIFASAASAVFKPTQTTLALGDSLAFGYSAQTFNENLLTGDQPTSFEAGYANQYEILKKFKFNKIQLVNNGCPGETTDSMIGNGPLGSILDPVEGETPCAYHTELGFKLHNEYGAGKSQLESTLEQLAVAALSGRPVTTVTLNIGANDELHAIAKCEAEVKAEIVPTEGKFFSVYGGKASSEAGLAEAGAAAAHQKAAEEAFGKGEVELGLKEKAAAEAAGAAAKKDFEKAGEEAVKGCIEFHFEGLVGHILKNVGTILFVLRNGASFGSINYTGKIIVQGGYDPYGRVYKNKEEVAAANALPQFKNRARLGEQLPGSNSLAAVLNSHEKELVEFGPPEAPGMFKACFAGVQGGVPGKISTAFNPGLGLEEGPKGSLQRFTNMNNQTSTSYPEPFAFLGPRPNGPDIHPTLAGAKDLAKVMFLDCG